MEQSEFEAKWADWLAQKTYAIYTQDGEYVGLCDGHDTEHAVSKFAQFDERDPRQLTAERAWPGEK